MFNVLRKNVLFLADKISSEYFIDAKNVVQNSKLLKSININYKDKKGNNLLLLLCKYNPNYDDIKLLIDRGIDVNDVNNKGNNSLMILSKNKINCETIKIWKLLIERGINVNQVNKFYWTPLLKVSKNNLSTDLISLLIENGAKTDYFRKKKNFLDYLTYKQISQFYIFSKQNSEKINNLVNLLSIKGEIKNSQYFADFY